MSAAHTSRGTVASTAQRWATGCCPPKTQRAGCTGTAAQVRQRRHGASGGQPWLMQAQGCQLLRGRQLPPRGAQCSPWSAPWLNQPLRRSACVVDRRRRLSAVGEGGSAAQGRGRCAGHRRRVRGALASDGGKTEPRAERRGAWNRQTAGPRLSPARSYGLGRAAASSGPQGGRPSLWALGRGCGRLRPRRARNAASPWPGGSGPRAGPTDSVGLHGGPRASLRPLAGGRFPRLAMVVMCCPGCVQGRPGTCPDSMCAVLRLESSESGTSKTQAHRAAIADLQHIEPKTRGGAQGPQQKRFR